MVFEKNSNRNGLGQYFTKKDSWLTESIREFIKDNVNSNTIFLDPFAGEGDLFSALKTRFTRLKFRGYDIDTKFNWKLNDSLVKIPCSKNDFIVTNPPYLSKNSCKRKGFIDIYERYFSSSKYDDLYLIALEKMLRTSLPGVAIVPETFINSRFPKNNIDRIVIIEPNPFEDTSVPICVVCFNGKNRKDTLIYKNEQYVEKLSNLVNLKPQPNGGINLKDLRFNDIKGTIAIRGFDSSNSKSKIKFLHKKDLNYDFKKIKKSSRAITIVSSSKVEQLSSKLVEKMIVKANLILNNYREKTQDVLLSPFKGNDKKSVRRRRLDFFSARNILELAYDEIVVRMKD